MPVPTPKTKAMLALEENLDSILHLLNVSRHEMVVLRAQSARLTTFVGKNCDIAKKSHSVKPVLVKLSRSLDRFSKSLDTRIERVQTITLWQVVMLVTCVEAYLQDVLTAAASVDPELMSKSEQHAPYADVIGATSLEALANELRARWARGWLSDGGPTRWIARLGKMGARGYPKDLGPRLERFWGIRHVVVHATGVATKDFVKRHPGVVKAAGNRVQVTPQDLQRFFEAVRKFINPTDAFFLKRYPSLLAAPTAPAKW